MEAQVREMEPILARKADEGIALVNRLKIEQKAADEVKQMVMKDEAEAKVLKWILSTCVFHYSLNSICVVTDYENGVSPNLCLSYVS